MSHEWTCRCPRCVRELDLPRDEPDPDDNEQSSRETTREDVPDAA